MSIDKQQARLLVMRALREPGPAPQIDMKITKVQLALVLGELMADGFVRELPKFVLETEQRYELTGAGRMELDYGDNLFDDQPA